MTGAGLSGRIISPPDITRGLKNWKTGVMPSGVPRPFIKDQTYALYNLTQEQLAHTLMPAGAYSKMRSAPWRRRSAFWWRTSRTARISASCRTGIMRPLSGTIRAGRSRKGISSHRTGRSLESIKGSSIIRWDSAKGLGLALGHPAFVLEIRPETNEVVIGTYEESLTGLMGPDQLYGCGRSAGIEAGVRQDPV